MTDLLRPPIVQYWHDEDIPGEIAERLTLVEKHNPDMQHRVFNEQTATALIEAHFTEREAAAFRACAVPAMQADYFRYCAVYALGGVYCDADSLCSGSLVSLLDPGGEIFHISRNPPATGWGFPPRKRRVEDLVVTNHLFGFSKPDHPLLKFTIDIATAGIESRFCQSVPTVTGPVIFTALVMMWRAGFDSFFERMSGWHEWYSAIPVEHESWLGHLEAIRSVVGSELRVAEAFEGVRVSPYRRVSRIVTAGSSWLSYRQTENHYPNRVGNIYRNVVPAA